MLIREAIGLESFLARSAVSSCAELRPVLATTRDTAKTVVANTRQFIAAPHFPKWLSDSSQNQITCAEVTAFGMGPRECPLRQARNSGLVDAVLRLSTA